MARKQNNFGDERRERFRIVRKWMSLATLFSLGIVAALIGCQEVQRYLLRDPQFVFPAPTELGEPGPNLEIIGVVNAPEDEIAAAFEMDYGRSLYIVPIEQRRLQLLKNTWVADASITRIWPNRVRVQISERTPVAWVQIPGREGASQPALIDIDGNILRPRHSGTFKLPVLTGLTTGHSIEERKLRLHRVMKLLEDAGPLAVQISEVDAADPANLKVMQSHGGRALTLIIGDRQYKRRLEKFRLSYPEIQKRSPDASIFDLRIDGNILSMPGGSDQMTKAGVPSGT